MKTEDSKTYMQTREILELMRDVYRKLADFFQHHAASQPDKRVAMLMIYMQRHEKQMEEVLSQTLSSISKEVLDAYYQFEPGEISLLEGLEEWHLGPDASVDEVIAKVIRFDEILRSYYARAAQMAGSESVAEVFRNLEYREKQNRNALVRDSLFIKDL